jgi:hypothetical protein
MLTEVLNLSFILIQYFALVVANEDLFVTLHGLGVNNDGLSSFQKV